MTDKEVIQWLVAQRDKAVDFNVELTPEIKEIRNRVAAKRREAYDVAIRAIEQKGWIPVSERLPEVGEKVLCQCQANIYEVLKLTVDGWYHDKNHCYMLGFVIAWMPLPEPYKEDAE